MLHAHRQLRASLSKSVCLDLLAALSKQGRIDDMLSAFAYMRVAQPAVEGPKALAILAAVLSLSLCPCVCLSLCTCDMAHAAQHTHLGCRDRC